MPDTPPTLDVSVVVPLYGGEATIETLVQQTAEALDAVEWTYEFLLVCDRPRDGSWGIARRLAAQRRDVTAVLLRRNFGQHPATLLGIRRARGRTIVTMDEDLQHAPSDVPALVRTSRDAAAIAYGVTRAPEHALWRNLTSKTAKWFVARYLGFDASKVSAFRAFPAEIRDAFADYRGERVAVDVLLSWAGAPAVAVELPHQARAAGASGYTFRKLVSYLLDLMLGYSTAPLRVASWMGVGAMMMAFGIGAYVLVNWLVHGSVVPGFAFLALSIAILSGVQLLSLGMIGEYLGRLYFNALGKPQYLVAEVVCGGAEDQGDAEPSRGDRTTELPSESAPSRSIPT